MAYASQGGASGGAHYQASPGLNLTYGIAGGSSSAGLYATVGVGLVVNHDGGTVTQTSANAGVGERWKVFRGELFVSDVFRKSAEGYPNELTVGVRLGVSIRK
jgi:hypothetical protein